LAAAGGDKRAAPVD